MLNRINQARIAIGNRRVYVGTDNLSGALTESIQLTDINGGAGTWDAPVSAIYWGHKDNPDLMLVAAGEALYLSTTSAEGSFVALTNYTGGPISDVAISSTKSSTFFVAGGTNVWTSTDSGATWSNLGVGLGALGIHQTRTLQFISKNGASAILVGGLGGFYAQKLEANATWFKVGEGMPNVPVVDSRYDEVDDVLIAGTLGRGAYTLPGVSASVFVLKGAPQITVQPKPQTVIAGSTVTLSVTVQSESAVTYQWRKGTSDIPGATASSLTLTNVSNADEANYFVVATNAVSSISSEIVKVTVNPAAGAEQPVLQITRLQDGRVKLSWQNGGRLQQTSDLNGPWADVPDVIGSFTEAIGTGKKFYRVANP